MAYIKIDRPHFRPGFSQDRGGVQWKGYSFWPKRLLAAPY
jgi:hypothetical protein